MTRTRILAAMLAIGMVLSLTAGARADASFSISYVGRSGSVEFGVGYGGPIVAPGCYPPPSRVIVAPPRWPHRVIHPCPPVVVHPPVVRVVHPPVIREVVVTPAPPVVVQETTITVWVTNSNGSRTSVQLTRNGPWYVGPRGEYYAEMPTNQQLRVAYGF